MRMEDGEAVGRLKIPPRMGGAGVLIPRRELSLCRPAPWDGRTWRGRPIPSLGRKAMGGAGGLASHIRDRQRA
jgi:hypothetical protein